MPRDANSLLVRKWAITGDRATPESDALTRAAGYGATYSQSGGDTPAREVFNQILLEVTSSIVELHERGLLEWDSKQDYAHVSLVVGSDGNVYISTQASGPSSTVQDPVSDTANTYWQNFQTAIVLEQTLSIAQGGTGATSAIAARNNLGLGALATRNTVALAQLPTVTVGKGGTGSTNPAGARSNLGLGSIATRNVVELTQTAYDALTTPDANTYYDIVESA